MNKLCVRWWTELWCFYSWNQIAGGSLVWEVAGRSRCSLLLFTSIVVESWDWGDWDWVQVPGSRRDRVSSYWLPGRISHEALCPAQQQPSHPLTRAGSWAKVWATLFGTIKLASSTLACRSLRGLKDKTEEEEEEEDRRHEAVSRFSRFVSLLTLT